MTNHGEASPPPKESTAYRLLERVAAAALLLVLAALTWMTVAAYIPDWGRLAKLDLEVILVIGLLLAALLLVSLVALLHTRRGSEKIEPGRLPDHTLLPSPPAGEGLDFGEFSRTGGEGATRGRA